MVELTINNIIKMIIAVFVLVAVIGGIYLGFKSYVIPFFDGLGFGGGDGNDNGFEEYKDICEGKAVIGILNPETVMGVDPILRVFYQGSKSNFFISEYGTDKYLNHGDGGEVVGEIINGQIMVDPSNVYRITPSNDQSILVSLRTSYIGGLQICK